MKIDADDKKLLELVERGEWNAAHRGKRGRTPSIARSDLPFHSGLRSSWRPHFSNLVTVWCHWSGSDYFSSICTLVVYQISLFPRLPGRSEKK